jgi:PEP-CTERM motif
MPAHQKVWIWVIAAGLALAPQLARCQPLPSIPGDFNNDESVEGTDFLIWQQNFDNGVFSAGDLADWRANFGIGTPGASLAGGPTPTVNLSLNVFPDPGGGGSWTLVAKTDSVHGIAAVNAYISNVDAFGVTYGLGINAMINGGSAFVMSGSSGTKNLVYGQDTSAGGVRVGVGRLGFSFGLDPFGDPFWNNATKIMQGTYSSGMPYFSANLTSANTLSTSTAPFYFSIGARTTTVVRFAVPEPATAGLIALGISGLALRHRKRGRSAGSAT